MSDDESEEENVKIETVIPEQNSNKSKKKQKKSIYIIIQINLLQNHLKVKKVNQKKK